MIFAVVFEGRDAAAEGVTAVTAAAGVWVAAEAWTRILTTREKNRERERWREKKDKELESYA